MTNELKKTFSYRISQASRSDMVVIMYDIAIQYLDDANIALSNKCEDNFCNNIRYAKRVIDELYATLDLKYELSRELQGLYMYFGKMLTNALIKKNNIELDRLRSMLVKLRESFYEVSKTDKSGPVMKQTEQVYAGFTYSNSGNTNEYASDSVTNRGYKI